MSSKKRFEELEVYKASCAFDDSLCSIFTYERFRNDNGLRIQALNSSGSCQDNIAEGFERGGNAELMNFLRIAKGSIGETRAQVARAGRRGWITDEEAQAHISTSLSISKQLGGFLQYFKNSDKKGERYAKEPESDGYGDFDFLNFEF